MSETEPTEYRRELTAKERESLELKKDIEQFLLNGGVIEHLAPAAVKKLNTVNVKKSTE